MALLDCTEIHGRTVLHAHLPECGAFEDVIYMPVAGQAPELGRSYGLYRLDGALIEPAGRFRGPGRELAGPALGTAQRLLDIARQYEAPGLVYLGSFTSHYGHFLIDTLCRLWALRLLPGQRVKILYHGIETPEQIFGIRFAAEVFGALGFTAADFVKFDEPVLVRRVVVAAPAFEELSFSHSVFGAFLNEIGAKICGPAGPVDDRPVYLTKMHVRTGISHYVNEEEFAARLDRAGVEIIAPERLGLRAQIEVFRSRRTVTGLIGSAFHTAGFMPFRKMLILNYGRLLWSNQVLLDQANGGRSDFVFDAEESVNEGPNGAFGNNFRMADPVRLAEDFLRRMDAAIRLPAARKMRVAVVLIVKDEASDIAAWLAWYDLLGFDACIVYDDDSTDGTWEILQQAAGQRDVRVARSVGGRAGRYEVRQELSYRAALAEYGGEFDWLAFFDADEYLLLKQDEDISAFLGRFENADAVAVNWCNYGSSGHLLKPDALPVAAYTWHGSERHHINRHVKSFVRPGKVGPAWLGVHCFDVAAERYVLSNGAPARWGGTPGIIDADPDWGVAKLMHYQCRSMEHFVERLKKRPELAGVHGIWQAYDLRDVQDLSPLAHLPALQARLAGPVAAKIVFEIGMGDGAGAKTWAAEGFRVIGVEPDVKRYFALRERFAGEIAAGDVQIYNFAAGARDDEIVAYGSGAEKYFVLSISWEGLCRAHGLPHGVRLNAAGDVSGFLRGIRPGAGLPKNFALAGVDLAGLEALAGLGYRRFRRAGDAAWSDFAAFRLAWQAGEACEAALA
jgi:hypothetical protein